MGELCIELQSRYEVLMDMIEKNTTQVWNYEMKGLDEVVNQSFSLKNSNAAAPKILSTEFIKLDAKFRFPPPSVSKRQWKLHFYE